jgi:[ribosomal protein S5]-alanine N-acetyltransferase
VLDRQPIRLRPFRLEELELLWSEREHTVPGMREDEARRRLLERIERDGELVEGRLDLGVEAEGRLVGHVEARQPKQAMPPGVFELGISIFEADRGKGYGTDAVAALTDLLLDEYGAHRVQASTDVLNAAMRAVLERLGYTFEGILRGFMPTQDGGRADYAMYGVTREDWEARPA